MRPEKRTSRHSAAESAAEPATEADAVAVTPALVEVEADVGFTVTEVVEVGSQTRGMHAEALTLLAADEFLDGIAMLEKVVAAVPDATAPLVDLGIAQSRAGLLEEAQTTFKHALEFTPDHPVAHNELGIAQRKLGQFAEARRSYERALTIYPGFHYARRNLGVLCDLYLADLDCALTHYGLYQAAVPDDPEVQIWVGDLQLRMAADRAQEGAQ